MKNTTQLLLLWSPIGCRPWPEGYECLVKWGMCKQKVVWKLLMCWLPEWFPLFDLPHFIIFCLPTQRSSPVLDIFQKHFLGNFSSILYTHVTNCGLVSSIIIGRVLVCWARVRGFKPSRTKTSVSLTNWVIKYCLCNDIC